MDNTLTEARYWEKSAGQTVTCSLCPRHCRIAPEHAGFCGTRLNRNGTLYNITAGQFISLNRDPIEKKPLYHVAPGSSTLSVGSLGCNLRCLHCQNSTLSHTVAAENRALLQPLPAPALINETVATGSGLLVFTYNEPLLQYEYLLEAGKLARVHNIKTVLVTAGLICQEPLQELLPEIDCWRVDIKGFTDDFYQRLTGGSWLQQILDNTAAAYRAGKHVEVVTNIIPNWNDDDAQLSGIAGWIRDHLSPGVPWHVTAYHPAYKMKEPPTPPATVERALETGRRAGLHHVYAGNIPGHTGQNTLCPQCGAVLITRSGFHVTANRLIDGNRCPDCNNPLQEFIAASRTPAD